MMKYVLNGAVKLGQVLVGNWTQGNPRWRRGHRRPPTVPEMNLQSIISSNLATTSTVNFNYILKYINIINSAGIDPTMPLKLHPMTTKKKKNQNPRWRRLGFALAVVIQL